MSFKNRYNTFYCDLSQILSTESPILNEAKYNQKEGSAFHIICGSNITPPAKLN